MSDTPAQYPREVILGDDERRDIVRIRRFKGYKALNIGRIVSKISTIGPDVGQAIADFSGQYRDKNVTTLDRATLEFRYPEDAAHVSEEAWEQSGGKISLPEDPSGAEVIAAIFPRIYDAASNEIFELLAWTIADDAKLEELDEAGDDAKLAEYIGDLKKLLLHRAELGQLLDIATTAQELVQDQLAGKADQAQAVLSLVGLGRTQEPSSESSTQSGTESSEDPTQTPTTPDDSSSLEEKEAEAVAASRAPIPVGTVELPPEPTDGSGPKPPLSTDSPPPTGGDESESSTAPTGEPSLSSTS